MSKAFDHPLNDKTLKAYKVLVSQQCSQSELLFSAAKSKTFISKKLYRHTSQSESHALVPQTSAKNLENNTPQTEPIDNLKSKNIQQLFYVKK